MYQSKIYLNEHPSRYELEELIKVFLRPEQYTVIYESTEIPEGKERCVQPSRVSDPDGEPFFSIILPSAHMEKNAAKRFLYDALSEVTGYRPAWGTLTGVRPTKMVNEFLEKGETWAQVEEKLSAEYYLNDEKISLLKETCRNQAHITCRDASSSAGIYIGIPFCPTRCVYCSFTSNQVKEPEILRYLEALIHEITEVGRKLRERNVLPESIYIGGGTPTTLSAKGLDRLLSCVQESFCFSEVREFTVEAGRPDTITAEKLAVIKDYGVDRISINPQSMNQKTLDLIGRSHTTEEIIKAFEIARKSGIPMINTDLIAGLPGETPEDFLRSLREVISLGPENITVHTLAVKRASRLKEINDAYNYEGGGAVGFMVEEARRVLKDQGYEPYYMYRQKHMTGNFENTGYTKPGMASVYNVRIMDEHQTIIALGAGAISKAYYHGENRLERVPNVSNYQIYIDRIDEMLQRKEEKLYHPFAPSAKIKP